MSIQAIAWAFEQQIESSMMKLLLLCFANYATEYGTAWCTIPRLQTMTGMNERTILKWIRELETLGYISDTGKREGETSRIKVYKLVAFQTHSKMQVLDKGGNTCKNEGGNTPILSKSPCTPYIDKPKINLKAKKSNLMTLAQWETKMGCQLCIQQMAQWGKQKNLNPKKVADLIEVFRTHCTANASMFADFVAAFQNWVNRGYLGVKLDDLKNAVVETYDRGHQL